MRKHPVLLVIAGPNGSGKSTYTRDRPAKVPLLDPDAIARQLNSSNPAAAAIEAGRRAILEAREFVSTAQSFAVETTLAGKSPLRLMEEAESHGFEVDLVFIGLEHPALNAERVAARVATGGHDVALADIERRFEQSIKNLPKALLLAKRAEILENSDAFEPFRLVVRKRGRTVTQLSDKIPLG